VTSLRETPSPTPPRTWAESRVAPWVLAAVVAAVFLPSLFGAFVFDDFRFILDNRYVRNPESWLRFLTDASTADPRSPWGIVRPLRTIEFAADRALFGESPFAFHVHSLLWHLAATVFLFLLVRRLLADARVAFIAALLWAIHPTNVESVAWISSRGDVAMGACSFAALYFAVRSSGYDRDLAASLVAAALAVLYKETGAMVPPAVVVLRWTKLSRAPLWPYLVLGAAYVVYHQFVQSGETGHHVAFVLGGSVVGSFATMSRGFGWYVCQSFVPAFAQDWRLAPSTSFADGAAVAWLVAHAAIVASAVALRRRAPRWTLAVLLFYVFLAPVANWPFCLGIATTERFLYVPVAGAMLAVGLALERAPRGTIVAALVAAIAFCATSVVRSTYWRDGPTLWTTVSRSHESPRAREFVAERIEAEAFALRDQASAMSKGPERDELERRVRALLEEALAEVHQGIDDTYAFELVARSDGVPVLRAEFNASNICWRLGRDVEALYHAEESIAIHDDVVGEPHYDRAMALLRLGFPVEAVRSMRRAVAVGMKFGVPGARGDPSEFFLAAGDECGRLGLRLAARDAYGAAVETASPGPLRAEAERRLAASLARPRTAEDDARERTTTAALDAKLAALPRSCPVRRDHSLAK
jgi:hypothetical protein